MSSALPLIATLSLLLAGGAAAVTLFGRHLRNPLDTLLLFCTGMLALPSVSALLLADGNQYHIARVWAIVLTALLAGILYNRRHLPALPGKKPLLILAGGLCLLTLLFSRPFEYLYGGWDPGEYVSTGSHITRTGGLDYIEPFLQELPRELEPRFFRKWAPPRATLHAGSLVLDADTGHMIPDYFHLYPSWLALFISNGSLNAAYPGQTVLAVVSVLTLILAIARMLSVRVAVLTGLFFIFQPAVLYFARFTSSEFLSMGLLFSILGLWKLQEETPHGSRALWMGWLVYGAVTCHITNLLPLAGIGLMAVFLGFKSILRTPGREILVLGAATGLGIIRNLRATPVFSAHLVEEYLIRNPEKVVLLLAVPLVLGAGALILWRFQGERIWAWRPLTPLLRWGPGLLFLLLAGYQYFLRPRGSDTHDAINLQSLGWLVSPLGLMLVLGSLFTIDWKKCSRSILLLLAATGLSAVVLIQHKNVQPIYFWAFRRYLPMVLPLFAILMAWVLDKAVRGPWKRWLTLPAVAAGLFCLVWQTRAALPVLRIREHQGLQAYVARIAQQANECGFLLADHWKLATPLRHGFGLPAYSLTQEPEAIQPDTQQQLHAFVLNQARAHAPALYLTHSSPFALPGLRLEPLSSDTHTSTQLEWRRSGLPRQTVPAGATAHLYQMRPATTPCPASGGPVEIEIGYHSLGLIQGFHPHRVSGGHSYRWTDGDAALYIPAFDTPATLILSLAHMRPEALGSTAQVDLLLDGTPLTSLTLGEGWTEHTVDLPAGTRSAFRLDLRSDTWNPADFDISGYPDRLGIRVERIRIAPTTGPDSR